MFRMIAVSEHPDDHWFDAYHYLLSIYVNTFQCNLSMHNLRPGPSTLRDHPLCCSQIVVKLLFIVYFTSMCATLTKIDQSVS